MKYLLFLCFVCFFSCSNRKLFEGIYTYEAAGTIYDCDDNKLEGVLIKFSDFNIETTTTEDGKWALVANKVSKCDNNVCTFSITYKLNNNQTVSILRNAGNYVLNGLNYSDNNIDLYIDKNNARYCINKEEHYIEEDEPTILD